MTRPCLTEDRFLPNDSIKWTQLSLSDSEPEPPSPAGSALLGANTLCSHFNAG